MTIPKLILAPIDFSEFSRNALDTAAEIASRFDASLLLVSIVPAVPDLPAGVSIFKEGEYDQNLHEKAAQRLAELAAGLAAKKLDIRTEVGTANDAGMEIVRIAEKENADMIVIATHGMTGWRKIAFGSVTRKVVEEATCAVLVLRAQDASQPSSSAARANSSSVTA